MPIWAIIYVNAYVVILILNTIFWLQIRQKTAVIGYQLAAGFYLMLLFLSYWTPGLSRHLSSWNVIPLVLVIGIDFFISVWVKRKVDIKKLLPDLDEESAQIARDFAVVEIAKATTILLSAPAYVIGFMAVIKTP